MSFQYNTATSFSDETYLESFVEAVSWTLPSDLQRSLQHLQMLDSESNKLMKHWRDTQDTCLHGVEVALMGAYRGDNYYAPPPQSPTLDTSLLAKRKSPASSERKKACIKCRNKKVKCDGNQPFCLFKEEYAVSNNSTKSIGDDVSATSAYAEYYSPPQKKSKLLSSDENDQDDAKPSSSLTREAALPMLDMSRPPTAAEIQKTLHARNPNYVRQREGITNLYHQLQQCSREKIHTANQLKSMIDMALGRLSRDIKKFEQDLRLPSSSSAEVVGGGGSGAVSVNQVTGLDGGNPPVAAASVAIPTTSAAAASEPLLATTPPSLLPHESKDLAAIQTTPNSPDWILAKVISYDKYTKMYTLSDEDVASNEIYTIPERQVRPLKGSERTKWSKGDAVYAVYPDTTSFYPAVVNVTRNQHVVMVHFKDDWDASGVIHEKAVPAQLVMKVP